MKIEAMFGRNELRQTKVYQEAHQEGELKGELKGEQKLVFRLLHRKLGSVPPSLEPQIQQLSVPQLEELGDALLDFASVDDLADWLQHH